MSVNGQAVAFLWAGFGALVVAWAISVMPGYPKLDETPRAAVWIIYGLCFVLGPVFITYWLGLGLVLAARWAVTSKEES